MGERQNFDFVQKSEKNFSQSEIIKSQNNSSSSNIDLSKKSKNFVSQDKFQFVTEDKFKKNTSCYICQSEFGQFQSRQHHCRLCAQSVCDFCSNDKVDDNRVCDLCYMKAQNAKGEQRKKQLKDTLKKYKKQMNMNLQKGGQELKLMEEKIKSKEEEEKKNKEKIKLDKQLLQDKLMDVEKQKKQNKETIEKFEIEEFPKKQKIQELKKQIEELDNELKVLETNLIFKEQSLNGKQGHFDVMRKNKREMEQSEDFQKLPNYDKAKKLGEDENLSEAIISLDKQIPPEKYFENESKVRSSSHENFNDLKSNQYQNSYAREKETNILLKDYNNRNRSESLTNIKTHNVRPRGDKFLCYN